MTAPERWLRVRSLLEAVVEQPAHDRGDYLARACAGTPEIRAEVESLLRAHDEAGGFLEPAPDRSADAARDPSAAPPLAVGTRLGAFELLAPLGAGGMGHVYRALDTRLGRQVALKLLAPSHGAPSRSQRWLEHEARAIARLAHPHVCMLHDVGMATLADGATHGFLVMELVDGDTLAARLARSALSPGEVVTYGMQIAEALAAAHAQGIVHGDLKPSNIALSSTGVKLLDFGLARLAPPGCRMSGGERLQEAPFGAIAGTLPYMAPETLRGGEADARSDLYALGVVLYEMLSGRRPFEAASPEDLAAAIVERPPQRLPQALDVPDALARVIDRCLAKEPGERWQGARDVALALDTVAEKTGSPPTRAKRGSRAVRTVVAMAGALATAVLGLTYASPARRALPQGLPTNTPAIRSLAVLPLEDLTAGIGQAYLSDGLTEALGTRLSSLKGIRVISRRSAMQFSGGSTPVPEIARTLRVDAVVAGSVQRSGDRVRVSAQLVLGTTGEILWSGTFDRDMGDVLHLQSELAHLITQRIDRTLAQPDPAPAAAAGKAYEEYLKGLFQLRQTTGSLDAALMHFEQALADDPSFAPAHLGLAETYASLGSLAVGAQPAADVRPRAIAAASRALSLDPNLATAHALLGRLKEEEWHWADGEAHYRRALTLDPNLVQAHAGLGWLLVCRGRLDEGIASSRLARELDPLSATPGFMLGVALYVARRHEEAAAAFESVLTRHPEEAGSLAFLGVSLLEDGRKVEAIRVLERAVSISDRNAYYLGMLVSAYARANLPAKARRGLRELQGRRSRQYVTPGAFVYAFTGLGELEAAMAALEEAYDERANMVKWVKVGLVFDGLRGDPRFEKLVERVGLE